MLSLKLIRGAENADKVNSVALVPPDQARFVIGRDPTCDWPIADKKLALSARHCEILRIEGRQVLRDLSTNGTFVNGARERLPADHVLRHGDRIALGSYLIEVSVVADAALAPAKAAAQAAPPAARRGGDPAAMVGADWERAALPAARGVSAADDVKTGLTRISKPPPKDALEMPMIPAAPRTEAGSDAAPRDPMREPVRRAPPGTTDVLLRLSGGLGIPVEALGTSDPAVAAERVARLLRVAVLALHRQLAAQARQLRELGSRAPLVLARSEAARLRMAPGPEEAVTALLASGDEAEAMLVRANSELGQHAQRLLVAFTAAGQRLGEQLAPAALERTAEGTGDPARLWKIYGSLWTALGIGVGKSWTEGFGEAVGAYLAAAYDDPQLGEKGGGDKPTR
jgi:type VI secretion system FHA domain protein